MDVQLGLFGEEQLPTPPAAVGPVEVDGRLREIAGRLPRGVRLGTSSWSFPGWAGLVYDRTAAERALAREGLGAYAHHPLLRTVGIDRTFYRSLPAADFAAYAREVPGDFRFMVKADRLVTSALDPEALGVRRPNPGFLDPRLAVESVVRPVLDGLGARAGPILFQFPPIPPNLVGGRDAFLDRLGRFVRALPQGPLYAFELRTPAFFTEAYVELLLRHGALHCYNVHPAMTPLERQLSAVQPYAQRALLVRWMLHSGLRYEAARERYHPFDRLVDEDPDSRELIAVAVLDAALAEREAFVIANNKAEGSAPLSIFSLAERIAGWGDAPGHDA